MLHTTYGKRVERQNSASKISADRFDKLVERQDCYFRSLARSVVASAPSIGIALVKLR